MQEDVGIRNLDGIKFKEEKAAVDKIINEESPLK